MYRGYVLYQSKEKKKTDKNSKKKRHSEKIAASGRPASLVPDDSKRKLYSVRRIL